MNESEARRVALTAAIAWCSTPEDRAGLSTSDMLTYAEQFETWLLRPSTVDAGLLNTDAVNRAVHGAPTIAVPVDRIVQDTPGHGMWCGQCNVIVAWCVHMDEFRVVSTCPCTFRSAGPACTSCGHDAHDPGTCTSTMAYTKPEPVVTAPEQRGAACTVCEHDGHDQGACTERGCGCLASRVVQSTTPPHDPYTDAAECTCNHFAHSRLDVNNGTCTFIGCPCTWTGQA